MTYIKIPTNTSQTMVSLSWRPFPIAKCLSPYKVAKSGIILGNFLPNGAVNVATPPSPHLYQSRIQTRSTNIFISYLTKADTCLAFPQLKLQTISLRKLNYFETVLFCHTPINIGVSIGKILRLPLRANRWRTNRTVCTSIQRCNVCFTLFTVNVQLVRC